MATRVCVGLDEDDLLEEELHSLSQDDPGASDMEAYFQEIFELQELEENEVERYCAECPYVRKQVTSAKLIVLQPQRVQQAYDRAGPLGLFFLFLTKTFIKTIWGWTNQHIKDNVKPKLIGWNQLQAYIGLEMAMSLVHFSDMKEYWAEGLFQGVADFKTTMSRAWFQYIRANIRFYVEYDNKKADEDPLYHSRSIMQQFSANASKVAVPGAVMTLDENSIPTKARTKARCFNKSKPHKFAIRMYVLVCWASLYLFSILDNDRGNNSAHSAAERYLQ